MVVNCFSTSAEEVGQIRDAVVKCVGEENVYMHVVGGGVLTELFLTNPHNSALISDGPGSGYEYALFALDDVRIQRMDIDGMARRMREHSLDVISPRIHGSTHSFMHEYEHEGLTLNNGVEVYMLLTTPRGLTRFFSLHTLANRWMWGVDALLGFFGLRAGVDNTSAAEHAIPQSEDRRNEMAACALMHEYLEAHTPFRTLGEVLSEYPWVKEVVG